MNTREIAAEYRLSHWAQIMQKRIDSGLSVRAFCENAGLHENNYYYWQRKLREAACEELEKIQGGAAGMMPSAFAEVRVANASGSSALASTNQNQVSAEVAGLRITAGSGYPVDKFAYLLRAVM